MLRWFVSVNRRAARKLEEKYPRFFLESHNFGDDFRATVRRTLEEKRPKVILEVGGVDRPALQKGPGYPAFFNHCDPISMRKLLERTGFRDVDFIIYYKATDYFAFFLPAYLLVATFENLASKMGGKIFASGMVVTATKP